jgi:hypothetical protein
MVVSSWSRVPTTDRARSSGRRLVQAPIALPPLPVLVVKTCRSRGVEEAIVVPCVQCLGRSGPTCSRPVRAGVGIGVAAIACRPSHRTAADHCGELVPGRVTRRLSVLVRSSITPVPQMRCPIPTPVATPSTRITAEPSTRLPRLDERRTHMTAFRALIATAILLAAAPPAWPCSVSVSTILSAVELVQQADAIVKVRAERLSTEVSRPTVVGVLSQVEFSVHAVLKGRLPSSRLTFQGLLTARDERNGRSVPYPSVRSSGEGSCFAVEYKRGADYLLFLKKNAGRSVTARNGWTPYWALLAPANEQLQGPNDAWELWVREQLRASNRR